LPVGVERGTPAARVIAAAWPLDLDDIGAEIAKDHRAEWSGEDSTEIQNSDA
jgi:hypothetical protein